MSASIASSPLQSPSAPSRFWIALIWLGFAVAVVRRFAGISRESLWFDEGYTAWMVTHPVREILRLIRADTAPPLYYLLLREWTHLFGHSEAGLRSMSAVLSVLTFLLVLGIARRFLANPVWVAAVAWLMVLGFQQQYYAQEARDYTLMAFLIVAAFDCLQRHLAASHRRWLVPMTLCTAAALYTHNMTAPYLVALAIAWLLLPSPHRRRRLLDGAIVAAATLVLYLPWAITSLPAQLQMVRGSFWVERPTLIDILGILGWMVGVPRYWDWNHILYKISPRAMSTAPPVFLVAPAWIGLVFLAGSAFFSIAIQRGPRRRQAIALFVFLMFSPAVVTLYSLINRPILMDKIFLTSAALMPVFLLLPLPMALSSRLRIIVRAGLGLLLLIAWFNDAATPPKEGWRQAAHWVSQWPLQPRLIVFDANDGELPFDYYYHYRPGEEATGAPAGFFDCDPPKTMLRVRRQQNSQNIQAKIAHGHYRQVVLVAAHTAWSDPAGYVLEMLRRQFPIEEHQDFHGVTVYRFDR